MESTTNIPLRHLRMVVVQTIHDLLSVAYRTHFSDVAFVEGVALMMVASAIASAQMNGEPFTVLGLAKHLGMPSRTLRRRLDLLESKDLLVRQDGRLHMNGAMASDAAILDMRRIIIDATDALRRSRRTGTSRRGGQIAHVQKRR